MDWTKLTEGAIGAGLNGLTGGLASAGMSLLSGLFGSSEKDKYNQQVSLMEKQAELNEKAMGTQYQNQRLLNDQAFQQQRQMNAESTMVQRQGLAEAGINPNFQNGAGPVTTSAAAGASSALGAGLNSAPPYRYSLAETLQASMLNDQLENLKSDTDLKKAERDKRQAEKDRQLIENTYLPQVLQGQIDLNGSVVKLNGAQEGLSKAKERECAQNILNLQKTIDSMNQQIRESKSRSSLLDQQQKTEQIVTAFKSKEMQALIKNYSASANLSYTQAHDVLATQVARIKGLDAEAFLKRQLGVKTNAEYRNELRKGVIMDVQTEDARVELDFKKEFGEVDHFLNSAGELINDVSDALNVVDKFTPKKSKSKSR